MKFSMAGAVVAAGRLGQVLQDGAVLRWLRLVALVAQGHQLLLQGLQIRHLLGDAQDMVVEQFIDALAAFGRIVLKFEQGADIGQADLQGAAVADELQPFLVLFAVLAIAGAVAPRFLQQARLFLVTHGFHVTICPFGQFSDTHGIPFSFFGANSA